MPSFPAISRVEQLRISSSYTSRSRGVSMLYVRSLHHSHPILCIIFDLVQMMKKMIDVFSDFFRNDLADFFHAGCLQVLQRAELFPDGLLAHLAQPFHLIEDRAGHRL